MRIWLVGCGANTNISTRIEWQDPASGETYYARTVGQECLFGDAANGCAGGQLVQKGIAARVLEYANQLTARGYKLDTVNFPASAGTPGVPAGFNAFGRAMVVRHPSGAPVVQVDPAIRDVTTAGTLQA